MFGQIVFNRGVVNVGQRFKPAIRGDARQIADGLRDVLLTAILRFQMPAEIVDVIGQRFGLVGFVGIDGADHAGAFIPHALDVAG